MTDHYDDYLCTLYPWWVVADSCAALACGQFSLTRVLEQCKQWVSLPNATANIRRSKGAARLAFIDKFVQTCQTRRRAMIVTCSENGCQYMSPKCGAHVLIHIPVNIARLFDRDMIKRIKQAMRRRHKASVEKLLALDRIRPSDLVREVPIGCCIPDAKKPNVLIPLCDYEGENKQSLIKKYMSDMMSIQESLQSIPQSPYSNPAYVRKLTPGAVRVKRRANSIRARKKKVRLSFQSV